MLAWPSLDALGVDAFVTTRHGGVSAGSYATLNLGLHVGDTPADVLVNRRRVGAALGADLDDFVFCNQAHGRRVAVVSAADRGRGAFRLDDAVASTDALVTTDPGTVLAILVADCVPVILTDPKAGVLACVHAGWRGTVAGVTGTALHAMQALGARPERIQAAIGPAVAADRYQVGPEVAAAAERFFGGNLDGIMRPDGSGRWLFDLPAANRRVIRESGVPDAQIHGSGVSTASPIPDSRGMNGQGPELFFSDRAARPCGRFAAVARLRPKEDQ
ncbi:MAG: Multi-copper polyphenol oxidoreductase, laccase [Actinomycetia bacterium]|nr:Multi-copper polyphenol oxidoreductase, laccase [Actinomycetes bacterium]MDX6339848.1 purine-nucleoside/S-methyl-5-thioadenosine phosphorylase / adenosine deaminase [Streptosporangiaceae bacterium]